MRASLTLLPALYLRDGFAFGTNQRVTHYRVQGLPDGDASISEFGGRWRIFRKRSGVDADSARSYQTAEDALTALRYEVAQNR